MAQTLADTFLADLDQLSDDEPQEQEDHEEEHEKQPTDEVCPLGLKKRRVQDLPSHNPEFPALCTPIHGLSASACIVHILGCGMLWLVSDFSLMQTCPCPKYRPCHYWPSLGRE